MTGKSGSKRKLTTEIREPRSGLGDLGKLPEARNLSLTGSLQLWYHIPSTSGAGGDATDTDLAGNQLGENLRFFSSRNCKESKIIKDWPMKTIWPWKKLKKESIVCSIFRAHSSSSRFSMDARWQRFHRCMCRAGNGPCAKGDAGPALRPALIVNKSFYCTQCNLMKVHLISFAYIYIYMYITIYIYMYCGGPWYLSMFSLFICLLTPYLLSILSMIVCLKFHLCRSYWQGHPAHPNHLGDTHVIRLSGFMLPGLFTFLSSPCFLVPMMSPIAYWRWNHIVFVFVGLLYLNVRTHMIFVYIYIYIYTYTYTYIYIYINIRIYSILS